VARLGWRLADVRRLHTGQAREAVGGAAGRQALVAERLVAERLVAGRLVAERLVAERLVAKRLVAERRSGACRGVCR
jgi:hypothetical protein